MLPLQGTAQEAPPGTGDQGGADNSLVRLRPPGTMPAPSLILTLNQERMFQESEWGRAVQARVEAEVRALAAENRRIEAELEATERELTAQRSSKSAAEFAPLAIAFDTHVEEIRAAQDAKSRAIGQQLEQDRKSFDRAVLPVLSELMAQLGASAILAEGALIISRNDIDVTDQAIVLINQRLPAPPVEPAAEETPSVPEAPAPDGTGQPVAPSAP